MKKRSITLIISTLLIASILQFSNTVLAGDENDPEIIDEELDLFGPRAKPGTQEKYSYLDIISAWFTEKSDEPDYLFLYLKVKDLEFKKLRAIYAIHWEYKGVLYAAGVHTHTYGAYQVFVAGNSDNNEYLSINEGFDFENSIVFFKVPKLLVGNPKQGDILTSTDAWTALRYRAELLTLVHGDGELIKDWAGYGRDYVIQYESIGVPYMHRIFGPTAVKPGYEIRYGFEATDPQREDVYFYVDWGDGFVDEWVGPYSSGDPEQLTHTWEDQGSYVIRAKAKDTNGYESDLAELDLIVIKARTKSVMLENLLNRFPLIKLIIVTILNRPLLL